MLQGCLFQVVVAFYILSSNYTVSFYGKQTSSGKSVCESVFQSVPCFSHIQTQSSTLTTTPPEYGWDNVDRVKETTTATGQNLAITG